MAYSDTIHYDAVKVEKLAKTAWTLLDRQIVLPKLVQTRNGDEFIGTKGDSVTIKVPGRLKARSRKIRPADENARTIQMDSLAENSFQISITEDLYSAVPIEDEVLKLDLEEVVSKYLAPQVRAVAIQYENLIADEIANADYLETTTIDVANPYASVVDAAYLLDQAYVPRDGRILVAGSGVVHALRKSPQWIAATSAGDAIAGARLRTGVIGQIAGYDIVEVPALPLDKAYLFHRSAFAASTISPIIPKGASFGHSIAGGDAPSLTWIQDYDFLQSRDRSLVHVYAGVNTFKDLADANADNARVAAGGLLRATELTLPST